MNALEARLINKRLPTQEERDELVAEAAEGLFEGRPRTRRDCENVPRPCPWVSCKHHLYLDVNRNGEICLNHPEQEVWELEHSCVLDVAENAVTLEVVGGILQLTRERIRQIEHKALGRLRTKMKGREGRELAAHLLDLPHREDTRDLSLQPTSPRRYLTWAEWAAQNPYRPPKRRKAEDAPKPVGRDTARNVGLVPLVSNDPPRCVEAPRLPTPASRPAESPATPADPVVVPERPLARVDAMPEDREGAALPPGGVKRKLSAVADKELLRGQRSAVGRLLYSLKRHSKGQMIAQAMLFVDSPHKEHLLDRLRLSLSAALTEGNNRDAQRAQLFMKVLLGKAKLPNPTEPNQETATQEGSAEEKKAPLSSVEAAKLFWECLFDRRPDVEIRRAALRCKDAGLDFSASLREQLERIDHPALRRVREVALSTFEGGVK